MFTKHWEIGRERAWLILLHKNNHIRLEACQSVKLHHNISSCQVAFAAVITCMSEQCKPGAPSHMTVPKNEASCNDVMSCG